MDHPLATCDAVRAVECVIRMIVGTAPPSTRPRSEEITMKKLMLDPDALQVETFATAGLPAGRGTVAGAGAGGAWIGADDTKAPNCDVSGAHSCGYSYCGENTCGTCDANSYCGNSCVLVCDEGQNVPIVATGAHG
jgi:hypothetical protein